jgi:hypothetical protein
MNGGAFSGLKLSEETKPLHAVDQRLFAPTPPAPRTEDVRVEVKRLPPPKPAAPGPVVRLNGKVVSGEATESAKKEVPLHTANTEQPLSAPETKSMAPFDINDRPWRKDSFNFTDTEFERLEDLKLELRRRFDLPATKNDIARVAFQGIFEDYARDPEKSRIVRQLRTKSR